MSTKRPPLVNNQIYHIVARGIEGRDIFQNNSDYYRAIHNLFEFNDTKPTHWQYRKYFEIGSRNYSEIRSRKVRQPRSLIAKILAFCLMPNHIHLLLQQVKDNGITNFMRKFCVGYAVYFNKKYERSGHLFQGRFRAVLIGTDNQLRSAFVYIHTNPAALIDSNWKEGEIKNPDEVIKFIENYKWSSYPDYLDKNNFPSITQRSLFNQIMPKEKWQEFVNDWVRYKSFKGWDEKVELE